MLELYVLVQMILQYCTYGNASVQYSNRQAVAEINDLILSYNTNEFWHF